MHTETDEQVRMQSILKERMTTAPKWNTPRNYSNFKPTRGTVAEYDLMKKDCAAFKQALRRQIPAGDYNRFYSRVEQHCRKFRPFKDKPYREWLGVLQAVWCRALGGELQALPWEYNDSGVQHRDIQKVQAIAEETTVKTKKPKIVKPPKQTHNIIGVRFLDGHNLQKVYSYAVPKKVKLHLGEEVVVPSNPDGLERHAIAVVVALNHTPEYSGPLKQVHGRIATVKA